MSERSNAHFSCFGPESRLGDVNEDAHRNLWQILHNQGDSLLGVVERDPQVPLGDLSAITEPYSEMSEITTADLMIGPPGIKFEEPKGKAGVWALTGKVGLPPFLPPKPIVIEAVTQENGYSLGTVPAQVSWDEKLDLVKSLVSRGFVPSNGIRGLHQNTYIKPGSRTVADLLRVEGSGRPLMRADRIAGAVARSEFVLGPVPEVDPDRPKRYVTLAEGEAVSIWRPADKDDKTYETRLKRLTKALKKGRLRPKPKPYS